MEKRRGHFLIIFDHIIRDFWGLALLIFLAIFNGFESIRDNYIIIALAIISPIGSLLKYYSTFYSIKNEMLIIESGIMTKTKTEIPLQVITTVDLTQNLIYQLFGVYKVKIDNASQVNDAAKKAEAVFALKKSEALRVKELLLSKSNINVQVSQQNIHKKEGFCTKASDFLLLGALQSKWIYVISGIPIVLGAINLFFSISDANEAQTTEDFLDLMLLKFGTATGITLIILCVLATTIIVSLISSMITYYKFKVTGSDDAIFIEYGLFNKKSYTLMKSKINGVSLRQPLFMRLFGYYAVEVFAFGYGNDDEEKKETALLFPIAKRKDIEKMLEELLPEFKMAESVTKPMKQALRYFFYNFKVILGLVFLIGMCFTQAPVLMVCSGVIFALILLSCWLQYKNTGLNIDRVTITATYGSYTKNTILIKTKSIERLAERSGFFKRKKGYTNINFSYLAPLPVSNVSIYNVTMQQYENAKEVLLY